jgi:hypothetical protein
LGSAFLFNGSQNGATSFAFHPDFQSNGLFYVICSSPTNAGAPDFFAKRPIDPILNGTDPRTPPFHDVLYVFVANPLERGSVSTQLDTASGSDPRWPSPNPFDPIPYHLARNNGEAAVAAHCG